MKAPMLQLRAALDLARLWRRQDKAGPARVVLNEAYERLTEGFATADLVDARQLPDHLAVAR
jgi:hypothetical protein